MTRENLGPASTSYRDWIGSAAAENSMVRKSGDLYKLAGIDNESSAIVAIDMWANSHGEEPDWNVLVYVADSASDELRRFDDLKAQEASQGSLPVREIMLHGVSLEDVVRCMKVVHFQLKSPHYEAMHITERGDHPPQD